MRITFTVHTREEIEIAVRALTELGAVRERYLRESEREYANVKREYADEAVKTSAPATLVDAAFAACTVDEGASPQPTWDDVKAAVNAYCTANGLVATKAALNELGVERASELKEEQYAAALVRLAV